MISKMPGKSIANKSDLLSTKKRLSKANLRKSKTMKISQTADVTEKMRKSAIADVGDGLYKSLNLKKDKLLAHQSQYKQ